MRYTEADNDLIKCRCVDCNWKQVQGKLELNGTKKHKDKILQNKTKKRTKHEHRIQNEVTKNNGIFWSEFSIQLFC